MIRTSILTWAVALLAIPAANAQITLRYQFKEGDKTPYVLEQKMKMTTSIMGLDVETKINVSLEMNLTVVEVAKDGAAKVQVKAGNAKVTMEGLPIETKDLEGQMVKALQAMEMTATMLPTGEMKDVKVSDDTIKAMKSLPGADKLGDVLGPDTFKAGMGALVFPTDSVSKGKSWTNKIDAKTPFGKMVTDNTYTYEGSIEKGGTTLEKIAVKPDSKFQGDPNAPIKVTIKSSKGGGHLLFDNKAGRLVESTTDQTTEMQVDAGGLELNQTVQQTTTFRLKTK